MTQEELDALMSGNIDLDSIDVEENEKKVEEIEAKHDEMDGHTHKQYDEEHLVTQLGEVTTESEKKATEIFDQLDKVLEKLDIADANIDSNNSDSVKSVMNDIRNIIFETMSIMQYQDIHRQKIERVVNKMRDIARLMNDTLDDVDDKRYAPSAKHIAGDNDTDDLVDDNELERLIAEMGNK